MKKNRKVGGRARSPKGNPKQPPRDENQRPKSRLQQSTALSVSASDKRPGRWLDEPKAEHEIVLHALEIANRALQRTVSVDEVLKALLPKEANVLKAAYPKDLSNTVCVILRLLCRRGCVFSPGKLGTRRFYGVASVLDSVTILPIMQESRRQRVLKLVRQTVQKLGRAARMHDILEHAASFPEAIHLSQSDITHDVLSLKEEGEILHVGSIRGDGKGFNLYLPADLNLEGYEPPDSLTWLQAVERTFRDLWDERAEQAIEQGLKPRPLSTGDVRARLRTSLKYAENLADPMVLVNAMQQLAKTKSPVVRKIKRPEQRAILWAPIGVRDDEIDLNDAYVSDVERVCEAVRRAEHALNRPVGLRDVRDQVSLDSSLQPDGSLSIFSILSDAAKETITEPGGVRLKRASQKIYRVGKIADDSYYSTSKTPQAKAFVEFGRLEIQWAAMRVEEQLNTLNVCSLPCVATGRVRLIVTELSKIMRDLAQIRESGYLQGESRHNANELHKAIGEVWNITHDWLDSHALDDPRLSQEVDTNVPSWTADELLEIVKPLYPRSQKLNKGVKLIPLIGDAIRRVPNPEYVNRFSKDQRAASGYLFDRTDALIYIAKEWGRYECCLQATLASNELGWLRDPRFVFPALESSDFNARLSAVACLAFLCSELGNEHLRLIVLNDPDSGVRQSALWAYGFAGGTHAQEFFVSRSKEDVDIRVRTFAQGLLQIPINSWWAFLDT
jgi:hypothetical protein